MLSFLMVFIIHFIRYHVCSMIHIINLLDLRCWRFAMFIEVFFPFLSHCKYNKKSDPANTL